MRRNRASFWVLTALGSLLIGFTPRSQEGSKGRDVPMTRAEECLAVHDGIGRRARFVELPDGRILLGTNDKLYTSSDSGMTWSEPWQPRYADNQEAVQWGEGSLVLFKDRTLGHVGRPVTSGEVVLRQRSIENARKLLDEERPDSHLLLWRSRDGGKTWSRPKRITAPVGFGLFCVHDVLIRSSSGRILLPVYGDDKRCYTYYSDDEGETWKASRPLILEVELDGRPVAVDGDEPTVVEVEPRKILALVRTDMGRLYQAWSTDDGASWQKATPTALAASSAPAHLGKIPKTGELVVVWSQADTEEMRKGFNRSRLSTAISPDKGRSWTNFQNIESSIEGTRVDAGPLEPRWAVKRFEAGGYHPVDKTVDVRKHGRLYGRFSYPALFFHGDHALVAHSNMYYDEQGASVSNGRIRVIPISWFTGGSGTRR